MSPGSYGVEDLGLAMQKAGPARRFARQRHGASSFGSRSRSVPVGRRAPNPSSVCATYARVSHDVPSR